MQLQLVCGAVGLANICPATDVGVFACNQGRWLVIQPLTVKRELQTIISYYVLQVSRFLYRDGNLQGKDTNHHSSTHSCGQ